MPAPVTQNRSEVAQSLHVVVSVYMQKKESMLQGEGELSLSVCMAHFPPTLL